MPLLLRLLLAHIISDFFLQTDIINAGKNAIGHRRWFYLFFHSLTHAITAYLLVGRWDNWVIPVIVGITHFIIDEIKTRSQKTTISSFVLDQLAHISVIVLISVYYNGYVTFESLKLFITNQKLIEYLIGYSLILRPTSIIINLLLTRWEMEDISSVGLPSAGKWIGFLERILILTFILTDNFSGVGFLLAAKSIFRFGDLNKAKDIKTTEYVMVGTLTSFAIAVLIGYIIKIL